jgi:hypothetical protein
MSALGRFCCKSNLEAVGDSDSVWLVKQTVGEYVGQRVFALPQWFTD